MNLEQDIVTAIVKHGATAVHRAGLAALEGDYTKMISLGMNTSCLSHAYAALSAGHQAMDATALLIDSVQTQDKLDRVGC